MDRTRLDGLASSITGRGQVEAESVFCELRELGLSPIEAIYVASRALHLSLPDAKTAIYMSAAWRGQREEWCRLHSGLEG
jgi:alpha-D-ribose 1-methylphosphonate 5-triphosphate synthase subunit PhnH